MKTEILKRPRFSSGSLARAGSLASALAVACLGATSALQAAVLDTLGGGPLQGFPNPYGYLDGNTFQLSQFNYPAGIALNTAGTTLYLADCTNNAVRKISQVGNTASSVTSTFANTNAGISRPVAIAVDAGDKIYVLNRGSGNNGTLLTFNTFGNPLGAKAGNLTNATAIALDGSTNVFITIRSNTVLRINSTSTNVVGVITNAGTYLKGIAVLDTGLLALSDAGNHGIWLLNPANGTHSQLTGFHGAGDTFGDPAFAQFRSPEMIAKAGGGMLVVADRGNHRVKTVDAFGVVRNLYGVSSAYWVTEVPYPGWWDGTVCEEDLRGCPEGREPVGIAVAPNGNVYSTEVYYHLFRQVSATGLLGPSGGGGGGTGTNVIVITPPSISPNTGYFPMGRMITVSSPNPDVRYTTDGTTPTQNSPSVPMSGNTGTIRWINTTNDLTALRVRAFQGTNGSATISGVPATTNSVGVPFGLNGQLLAGVGSKIVVPVVADLRTNDTVKSYIFRLEVTPDGAAPMISDQFEILSVSSNDFIRVVTAAQGATNATVNVQHYSIGTTRGLGITAIGTNANVVFNRFAIVAMVAIPIPPDAQEGQTYRIDVVNSSATADGGQTAVTFPAKPAASILVTNLSFTVGDCALGGWYNAGEFGNHDLDNADVNNAFYAATGLRIPYTFSDVYNSMDAWPPDDFGFLGGDGELTFLDWQVTLQRAFRLDPSNWIRAWASAGDRTNDYTTLVQGGSPDLTPAFVVAAPWNRQALVGAKPVGSATAGAQVNVPIYLRTASGVNVKGLQFTCYINPENGGPSLSAAPQFIPAPGISSPLQGSSEANNLACGWSLESVSFASHTSNYLGSIRFNVPANAVSGQAYTVTFARAGGALNINTPYSFETKRAVVTVSVPAAPVTDITSDEWKAYFFGSLTAPEATPDNDNDHDGVPNWAEYIAGTDPTDINSNLRFDSTTPQSANGQRQLTLSWLSAPGKTYEILGGSTPAGATGALLGTALGDGTVKQFTDFNPGSTRFYRLRVQP